MRMVVVLFCAALAPAVLRAQGPAPAAVPDPALVAAATLARMSDLGARPALAMPWTLDTAVASDSKKKKDRRTLGLALMIGGVAAIVGGIAYGGNGALVLIIAGGLMEGYGYTLYHGGK